MQYEDTVYGSVKIEEPVLLDLLESAAVQRLHGVLQHGISGLIGVTAPITRFQHSVGAMLLVRQLDGSLEEQIAALLHDVSHTAFSHVIDYVFDGHDTQSYHEDIKEAFVCRSDIPQVLAAHGYDWRSYLHEEAFSLLEQPAPRLCADRLDYFLRDSLPLALATTEDTRYVQDHLIVHDGRIVMDELAAARWLGDTFMAADEASWANFREVGLYELTAQALRRALEIGALEERDLWGIDRELWERLVKIDDPLLNARLALISTETRFVWDEENPDFVISTKLRTIDPEVLLSDDDAVPLSRLDPDFAARRQRYLDRKEGPWPMRVVSDNK